MVVMLLVLLKVAISELAVPVNAPGKVPTPVLQLLVVAAATQLLLKGEASQVALAARAWFPMPIKPSMAVNAQRVLRDNDGRGVK